MILMRQMMLLMAEDSDDDADGDDDADDAHDANNVYTSIYIFYVYTYNYIHTYIHIMSSPRLAIFTYSTSNNPAEFCRVSSLPGGHLPMMPDAGQI